MAYNSENRSGWAAAASLLSGAVVIVLYLALTRQHDVWFGRSTLTASTGMIFFGLWALVGIGVAGVSKIGSRGLATVCTAVMAAALVPLLLPDLLVRSWGALLLAPAGVARGTLLTAIGWRMAIRLAVPGLAAGSLAVGCAYGPNRVPWHRAVLFLAGGTMGASLFRWGLATLGFERLLIAVVCLAAVTALLYLFAATTRGWRATGVAVAAASLVALALFIKSPQALLAEGVFARWTAAGSAFAGGTPIFHRDGARTSATVYHDPDYGHVLAIDGRPAAFENRFKAGRLLEAHLPLLLAPRVGRIALFGEEAPLAMATARAYVPLRLVCRGADPAIIDAVRFFETEPDTAPPASDNTTTGSARGYDVLQVMAGPAWTRQGGRALTADAFRRYARVVTAEGLVAVALDGRALTPAAFQTTVATFTKIFPHAHLWCTGLDRWLLLGSSEPLTVPLDRLLTRFENPAVFHALLGAGVTALPELLSTCVLDESGVRAYVAHPSQERHGGTLDALFARGNARRIQAAVEPYRTPHCAWLTDGADAAVADSLRQRVATLLAVRGVVVTQLALPGADAAVPAALQAAAGVNPRDLLLRELAERVELEAVRRLAFGDANGAIKRFEELLLLQPDDPVTHFRLSLAQQYLNRREAAFWHSGRAAALAPETAAFRMRFAEAALQAGQHDEAKRQYRQALALDSDRIAAKIALARLLGDKRVPGYDLKEAVRLAEEAFKQTGQRHVPTGYALADLYIEAGRVFEGVALKRTIKKLLRTSAVQPDE